VESIGGIGRMSSISFSLISRRSLSLPCPGHIPEEGRDR
jgi:hypothetical protein